jgi:hypothetical protein
VEEVLEPPTLHDLLAEFLTLAAVVVATGTVLDGEAGLDLEDLE